MPHDSPISAAMRSSASVRRLLELTALLAGAGVPAASHGQSEGVRAAPLAPQLAAGTRALAMGNVLVAGRGSEVLFYNPAQLALAPGIAVAAQRYGSASTLGTLAAATSLGGTWGVAAGVQLLDYNASADAFPALPAALTTRGPIAAASRAAALGVSAQYKGMRWGLAAKYVDERLPSVRDGALVLDLGAARDVGPLTVGLAAQNLGPDLRAGAARAEMPRRVTLGAAATAPPLGAFVDLTATAAVSVLRDGFVAPAGGVELSVTPLEGWTFAARVGARRVVDHAAEQPVTVGAGFSIDRLSLDYAYEGLSGRGGGHRAGVQIR